ncbi:MAG: aminotransferase class I/II-fold pyridoxal phosphate-dependent enzyme [Lachnospiraceae bacterium]|nr:aminotransferase class I/II-fold pyridoxal phosphate-dependent enzyme [Lachnospiraceae bacterium]
MHLYDKLVKHAEDGAYPMHMPGHKRNGAWLSMGNPYLLDITEIEGFDDLHAPEGILREGMERAARLYGADESWYLVNGSTAGILAGIAAVTRPGDTVLVARNCHRSVYHALLVNRLEPVYLYPPVDPDWGIWGSVRPQDVKEALEKEEREISLVVITSPTYEGGLSDVGRIAEICHAHGVPLLVDEAHGAHLGFSKGFTGGMAGMSSAVEVRGDSMAFPAETAGADASLAVDVQDGNLFPAGAVSAGADLVVQSLHKTLPSLTQTGLLHCRGKRISGERVKESLDIYQTSSPSYILMASIDRCLELLEPENRGWMRDWEDRLRGFYLPARRLRGLRVLTGSPAFFARDSSKLVLSTRGTGHTGPELAERLRRPYGFEPEMTSTDYVIAMTGAGDTWEAMARFTESVLEIDDLWMRERGSKTQTNPEEGFREEEWAGTRGETENRERGEEADRAEKENRNSSGNEAHDFCGMWDDFRACPRRPLWAARLTEGRTVPLNREALGMISRDFVYAYPPGIPILAPGEEITESVLSAAALCKENGVRLRGPVCEGTVEIILNKG